MSMLVNRLRYRSRLTDQSEIPSYLKKQFALIGYLAYIFRYVYMKLNT